MSTQLESSLFMVEAFFHNGWVKVRDKDADSRLFRVIYEYYSSSHCETLLHATILSQMRGQLNHALRGQRIHSFDAGWTILIGNTCNYIRIASNLQTLGGNVAGFFFIFSFRSNDRTSWNVGFCSWLLCCCILPPYCSVSFALGLTIFFALTLSGRLTWARGSV